MKLTKIIATIGPACESEEKIGKLIDLGVNVFRFNLKHNELPWHKERIDLVKKVAADKDTAVGVLIDLQGPEIRTRANEDFEVITGEEVFLGESDKEKKFNISHPDVLKYFEAGQQVVVDDGRLEFKVKKTGDKTVVLEAVRDGFLKNRKTLNIPGATYPMPALTEKDIDAVKMAGESEVDFIALSFVRTAADIEELKKVMAENNVAARVISKVEAKVAIDNLDEIVAASEGIMVARGDLGIEMPIEQVPFYQKLMIKKCLERGIPVITATQMLHSMTENPYPTRAEISDVANAAYDFTDSVMLSEETAMGKHPERTVEMMSNTVKFSENKDLIDDTRKMFDYYILDTEEMLCSTAYNLYLRFLAKGEEVGGFIVFSQSGRTGRKLSRYRPKVPVFVMTPNQKVRDGLTMSFGVEPFVQPTTFKNKSVRIEDMQEAFDHLKEKNLIDPEKYYILLYGDAWGVEGGVSTIKIIKLA